jgi:hypothetical protein
VAASNLRQWEGSEGLPIKGKCLVLAVTPYSQYDRTLLDILDESLDSGRAAAGPVYVVNLLEYDNVEQVREDFPGIVQVHQTPLAALWEADRFGTDGPDRKAKVPALDIPARFERSRAMAVLAGLGGDAKSGVTKEEARTFADQAVAALANAVKAGWAVPTELKEPDFDALRGPDDFQKLLAEWEAWHKAGAVKKQAESK